MTWRLYLNHPDEELDSARDVMVIKMQDVCGLNVKGLFR